MDLGAQDILTAHYYPCERDIKNCLHDVSTVRNDVLTLFIDGRLDLLDDSSHHTVITDHQIAADRYPHKTVLRLPDSIHGIYFIPDPVPLQPIDRDFNLFINRADVHRLWWFYKIIELDLLDRGYVSYIGSTKRSSRPELTAAQFVDALHQQYFFPHNATAYEFARQRVPYQNFEDRGDLRGQMTRSKVSIVIETYIDRPDLASFSEKIFRAIQTPRPWVLSAATGTVDRLRKLGFDVFDQYIDHDYDSLCTSLDMTARNDLILQQVMRIKDMTVTDAVLQDWHQRYRNNMEILANWHARWKQDFREFLQKNFPDISTLDSLA